MKLIKIIIITLFIFKSTLIDAQIQIPALSPSAKIEQQIGLSTVTIDFHKPSLRGRKLLGQPAIPYGKVWRLGANEVTTITVNETIEIEGKKLEKGKYALVAIPNLNEWTIVINSDEKQWGVYDYNPKKDVLRFNVKIIPLENYEETMSFSFEETTPTSANLFFKWENISFKINIKHDVDARVMQQIKVATSKTKPNHRVLMESAEYYLMMNRDLEQALIWSNQVLEKVQSPFRYNLKAQIALKLRKFDEAKEAATKAIEYANKSEDAAAIALAENIIKDCNK
jgi:tetratricopeptide (TPR) repeat protein